MDAPDTSSSPTALDISRANFRLLVLDIAWFGVAFPATSRFLSVYAIRLGASPMLLGLLAALPSIIALGTSSLTVWWRRRFPDSVKAQFWPGVGFRLVFLLPAFTPLFPDDWQTAWLLVAVSLPAFAQGLSGVVFLVLLRETIDRSQLTALMSRRSVIFNVVVAISTLALGFWLGAVAFPINYQVMFVGAFLASLISLRSVSRTQVIEPEPPPPADQPPIKGFRSPAFRRVAYITILIHVTFFSILALIPLRLVDTLGADEGFMSIFALAELIAAASLAAFTDRIVKRIGSMITMAIGMVGTGIAGFAIALAPSMWLTLPAAALSGAMWTMTAISLFGYFSENTPPDRVTRYSTLYNQIIMLSVFVGPLVGSQLAGTPLGLTNMLLIGSALRLLAGFVIPLRGHHDADAESHPRRRLPRLRRAH